MALDITIAPVASGWAVKSSLLGADLFFLSGGRAESAARALAARLARAGHAAVLEIVLRDGSLAGRIRFPAFGPRSGRASGTPATA